MKTNFSFDMQALDEGIHSRFPNHKEAPLIGLTGLSFRLEGYRWSFLPTRM